MFFGLVVFYKSLFNLLFSSFARSLSLFLFLFLSLILILILTHTPSPFSSFPPEPLYTLPSQHQHSSLSAPSSLQLPVQTQSTHSAPSTPSTSRGRLIKLTPLSTHTPQRTPRDHAENKVVDTFSCLYMLWVDFSFIKIINPLISSLSFFESLGNLRDHFKGNWNTCLKAIINIMIAISVAVM